MFKVAHFPSEPMLYDAMYHKVMFDMRSLHDDVLRREQAAKVSFRTLTYQSPTYIVKVPRGLGFVEDFPADKFYIDF